jgi:hypothetical protein
MSIPEQLELDLDYEDTGPYPEPMFPEMTAEILNEIWLERVRQDEKWGLQEHRYFSGELTDQEKLRQLFATNAKILKEENAKYVEKDSLGWDTILSEEFSEALEQAGIDDEAYERELVEAAAVAVAMIEANRRKRGLYD